MNTTSEARTASAVSVVKARRPWLHVALHQRVETGLVDRDLAALEQRRSCRRPCRRRSRSRRTPRSRRPSRARRSRFRSRRRSWLSAPCALRSCDRPREARRGDPPAARSRAAPAPGRGRPGCPVRRPGAPVRGAARARAPVSSRISPSSSFRLTRRPPATFSTSPGARGASAASRFAATASPTKVKSRVCSPSPNTTGASPRQAGRGEARDHGGVLALRVLARAVDVEVAERHRLEPVEPVVELAVALARVLLERVGRERARRHASRPWAAPACRRTRRRRRRTPRAARPPRATPRARRACRSRSRRGCAPARRRCAAPRAPRPGGRRPRRRAEPRPSSARSRRSPRSSSALPFRWATFSSRPEEKSSRSAHAPAGARGARPPGGCR